ncbi:hypothetical protein Bho114_000010, partial [Bartonella sp. 114]
MSTATLISKENGLFFSPCPEPLHLLAQLFNFLILKNSDEFKKVGIDEIYCVSVNDAFVMNAWGKDQGIKNVKLI